MVLANLTSSAASVALPPTFSSNPKNNSAYFTTYDTSGPYTDKDIDIDITKGLPKIREKWILDRGQQQNQFHHLRQ